MKRRGLVFLAAALCCVWPAVPSYAQKSGGPQPYQAPPFDVENTNSFYSLRLYNRIPDMSQERRSEPFFDKITYMELDPPSGLADRIDRLVYGIRTDVPPQYDQYGYEIRRYMAKVGGAEALSSPETIKASLRKIASARIVLRYWRDELRKEITQISESIEKENASSSERIRFKLNRNIVETFISHAEAWLERNYSLLEFLETIGKFRYTYKDGTIYFKEVEDFLAYSQMFEDREKILMKMREYYSFARMVY